MSKLLPKKNTFKEDKNKRLLLLGRQLVIQQGILLLSRRGAGIWSIVNTESYHNQAPQKKI